MDITVNPTVQNNDVNNNNTEQFFSGVKRSMSQVIKEHTVDLAKKIDNALRNLTHNNNMVMNQTIEQNKKNNNNNQLTVFNQRLNGFGQKFEQSMNKLSQNTSKLPVIGTTLSSQINEFHNYYNFFKSFLSITHSQFQNIHSFFNVINNYVGFIFKRIFTSRWFKFFLSKQWFLLKYLLHFFSIDKMGSFLKNIFSKNGIIGKLFGTIKSFGSKLLGRLQGGQQEGQVIGGVSKGQIGTILLKSLKFALPQQGVQWILHDFFSTYMKTSNLGKSVQQQFLGNSKGGWKNQFMIQGKYQLLLSPFGAIPQVIGGQIGFILGILGLDRLIQIGKWFYRYQIHPIIVQQDYIYKDVILPVYNVFKYIQNIIIEPFKHVIDQIKKLFTFISDQVKFIISLPMKFIESIQSLFTGFKNGNTVQSKVMNDISSIIMGIFGVIGDQFKQLFNGIKQFQQGIKSFNTTIGNVIKTTLNAIETIFNQIHGFISGTIDKIKGIGSWLGSGFKWIGGKISDVFHPNNQNNNSQVNSIVNNTTNKVIEQQNTTNGETVSNNIFNTTQNQLNKTQNIHYVYDPKKNSFVAVKGKQTGGYTGNGQVDEVQNVVHKGEYVVPNWIVKEYPQLIQQLEQIRTGIKNNNNVNIKQSLTPKVVSDNTVSLWLISDIKIDKGTYQEYINGIINQIEQQVVDSLKQLKGNINNTVITKQKKELNENTLVDSIIKQMVTPIKNSFNVKNVKVKVLDIDISPLFGSITVQINKVIESISLDNEKSLIDQNEIKKYTGYFKVQLKGIGYAQIIIMIVKNAIDMFKSLLQNALNTKKNFNFQQFNKRIHQSLMDSTILIMNKVMVSFNSTLNSIFDNKQTISFGEDIDKYITYFSKQIKIGLEILMIPLIFEISTGTMSIIGNILNKKSLDQFLKSMNPQQNIKFFESIYQNIINRSVIMVFNIIYQIMNSKDSPLSSIAIAQTNPWQGVADMAIGMIMKGLKVVIYLMMVPLVFSITTGVSTVINYLLSPTTIQSFISTLKRSKGKFVNWFGSIYLNIINKSIDFIFITLQQIMNQPMKQTIFTNQIDMVMNLIMKGLKIVIMVMMLPLVNQIVNGTTTVVNFILSPQNIRTFLDRLKRDKGKFMSFFSPIYQNIIVKSVDFVFNTLNYIIKTPFKQNGIGNILEQGMNLIMKGIKAVIMLMMLPLTYSIITGLTQILNFILNPLNQIIFLRYLNNDKKKFISFYLPVYRSLIISSVKFVFSQLNGLMITQYNTGMIGGVIGQGMNLLMKGLKIVILQMMLPLVQSISFGVTQILNIILNPLSQIRFLGMLMKDKEKFYSFYKPLYYNIITSSVKFIFGLLNSVVNFKSSGGILSGITNVFTGQLMKGLKVLLITMMLPMINSMITGIKNVLDIVFNKNQIFKFMQIISNDKDKYYQFYSRIISKLLNKTVDFVFKIMSTALNVKESFFDFLYNPMQKMLNSLKNMLLIKSLLLQNTMIEQMNMLFTTLFTKKNIINQSIQMQSQSNNIIIGIFKKLTDKMISGIIDPIMNLFNSNDKKLNIFDSTSVILFAIKKQLTQQQLRQYIHLQDQIRYILQLMTKFDYKKYNKTLNESLVKLYSKEQTIVFNKQMDSIKFKTKTTTINIESLSKLLGEKVVDSVYRISKNNPKLFDKFTQELLNNGVSVQVTHNTQESSIDVKQLKQMQNIDNNTQQMNNHLIEIKKLLQNSNITQVITSNNNTNEINMNNSINNEDETFLKLYLNGVI